MNYLRYMMLFVWCAASLVAVQAQNRIPEDDLTTDNLGLSNRVDAFGQMVQMVTGTLMNTSDESAYRDVTLYADLLDDDDEIIGEAFGFLVDACGKAILDFPLQPEATQSFELAVDLYEPDATIDTIEIVQIDATASDPAEFPSRETRHTERISSGEVVSVQWEDATTLRYGIGCHDELFTTYDWFQYDLQSGETTPLDAAPNADKITEAFIQQTGINQVTQTRETDPTLIERSFLTFPDESDRIVYQTDIHAIITAQEDGSFKRVVYDGRLSVYTLQGFVWSPVGNFVAYYFGAFGEPVRYFTAAASGTLISALLPNNPPSVTVPGLTDDARRVIIGGTFPADDAADEGDEITGYWLQSVVSPGRELLFEVDELPGNNYPAPAYYRKDASTRYIFVVRPDDDGTNVLQCYFREADELTTLTELPLFLEDDEQAWSWLSPDFTTLAIAATGNASGLWLVDLSAFDVCQ